MCSHPLSLTGTGWLPRMAELSALNQPCIVFHRGKGAQGNGVPGVAHALAEERIPQIVCGVGLQVPVRYWFR